MRTRNRINLRQIQMRGSAGRLVAAATLTAALGGAGGLTGALLLGCGPPGEVAPVAATAQPIVGGSNADEGEYPFAVQLTRGGSFICGGSLVARNWVLTAAHCVQGLNPSSLTAVIGRTRRSSVSGETRGIAYARIHPDRRLGKHDVALLRLSVPSTLPPIALASPYVTGDRAQWGTGATATVIGWGLTSEGGSPSDMLQEVEVPVIDDAVAARPDIYGTSFNAAQEVAAGPLAGGRDSCQGDSGGPLMVPSPTGWRQFGVVSWGSGCARPNRPGVYARVGDLALYPWVRSVLSGESIDVNGDGRADVCARGGYGINCSVSPASGSAFLATGLWTSAFSDAWGWILPMYYSTIRFADLDGDGKTDVCGRAQDGVWCALSTGSTFAPARSWQPPQSAFSDANGWGLPQYYSTLRLVDVNGDARADLCGRAQDGVWCALSTGSAFGPVALWQRGDPNAFSDTNHFDLVQYYSTIRFADVDGDGKADLCGRGEAGVYCARSTGSTFGPATLWQRGDPNAFSNANHFDLVQYYSTILLGDLDNDGDADLCARGEAGVYCALSSGSTFSAARLSQLDAGTAFSDANGWNLPQFYSTLRLGDLDNDGDADLCGRGEAGVHCALSALGPQGHTFGVANVWQSDFSDANGWNGGPQYYSTIGLLDLDGDGKADLCGRGFGGINCSTSMASMVSAFGANHVWQPDPSTAFNNTNGWSIPQYYSTIQYAR